jgi:Eukaryotic aspartyl protease
MLLLLLYSLVVPGVHGLPFGIDGPLNLLHTEKRSSNNPPSYLFEVNHLPAPIQNVSLSRRGADEDLNAVRNSQWTISIPFRNNIPGRADVSFNFLLDTGSPQTWIARDGYTCTRPNGPCNIESPMPPDYYTQMAPVVPFTARYVEQTGVMGNVATAYISLTDVDVLANGQIGIADQVSVNGFAQYSGILGLSGPGENPTVPTFLTQLRQANPQLTNSFALALSRQNSGVKSYIEFGGDLSTVFPQDGLSATVEVDMADVDGNTYQDPNRITKYHVNVDAFSVSDGTTSLEIVPTTGERLFFAHADCGVNYLIVPDETVRDIMKNFNPPFETFDSLELPEVACDAKAPLLSFKIGGEFFDIDPQDLVVESVSSPGRCYIPVQGKSTAGNLAYTLGAQFFKNTVVAFDLQARQIKLSGRQGYSN